MMEISPLPEASILHHKHAIFDNAEDYNETMIRENVINLYNDDLTKVSDKDLVCLYTHLLNKKPVAFCSVKFPNIIS